VKYRVQIKRIKTKGRDTSDAVAARRFGARAATFQCS
jgi:hypothetical protein